MALEENQPACSTLLRLEVDVWNAHLLSFLECRFEVFVPTFILVQVNNLKKKHRTMITVFQGCSWIRSYDL